MSYLYGIEKENNIENCYTMAKKTSRNKQFLSTANFPKTAQM